MEAYFHGAFRTQLESLNYSEPNRILREARDLDGTVFFGGQDWKNVEQDLAGVPAADRCQFVLCLFMVVLNDQALHASRPDLYQRWREKTAYPKFGWAGFGAHFENPFKLLSIPEQRGLIDPAELVAAMPTFIPFYLAITSAQLALVDPSLSVREHVEGIRRDLAYGSSEGQAVSAFKTALEKVLASQS